MEWVIAAIAVAILGVAAMAAAGGLGEMSPSPDRDVFAPSLPPDRPLLAADLAAVRFGVTLRGYAMGQVDAVLERVAVELAERDAQIASLTGSGSGAGLESGAGSGSRPEPPPPPLDAPEPAPEGPDR